MELFEQILYVGFISRPPVMARHGSWVVEATADNCLVGYCWATPAAGGMGRECVIDEVGVLDQHRRTGVAKALCRETAA